MPEQRLVPFLGGGRSVPYISAAAWCKPRRRYCVQSVHLEIPVVVLGQGKPDARDPHFPRPHPPAALPTVPVLRSAYRCNVRPCASAWSSVGADGLPVVVVRQLPASFAPVPFVVHAHSAHGNALINASINASLVFTFFSMLPPPPLICSRSTEKNYFGDHSPV